MRDGRKSLVITNAAACGLPRLEYLRKRVLGYEPRPALADSFYQLCSKLCDLCNQPMTFETELGLISDIRRELMLPKKHKFDMILTREVSRFARNTMDALQHTRMLEEHGVEVYFINAGVETFDGDGELRLTIRATLARDESRKTSIRVKSGQQTSMNHGVYYGNGNILGDTQFATLLPDKTKLVDYVIDPEQAKTVRMIFDLYLDV